MYKDKEKQREANKESARRYRKGMTEGMTESQGMTQYPDIIDKLTDPVWRSKLEKICHAFKVSHQSYSEMLGDTNLSVVCDLVECTR